MGNKNNKPAIRFQGFTEAWEQRKLGEVVGEMYNGQTPSRFKDEYWKGNINWLSSGELNRGTVYSSIETITEAGQKSANLRIVPSGTFIMAISTDFFLLPNKLSTGGFSGLAIILYYIFKIPVGIAILFLNIPLLITHLFRS